MSTSTARLPRVPESVAPLPSVPETRAKLPAVPESVAPLPKIPESRAPLPRVRETILPAGTIPYIPPRVEIISSSEESSLVDVLGIHSLVVESSSEYTSSVALAPTQYLEVSSSSEETSDVEVSDARPLDAVSESEESSSVEIAAVLAAESSSEESSSVVPGIDAVSSSEESSSLDVELIGVLHPVSSSEETSLVDVRTFEPSGMILGTESTTRISSTFTQIPGTWIADPAYPGSTMNGNSLVAQSGGSGLTISASAYCHNNNFISAETIRLQVSVNGTAVGSTPVGSPASVPGNSRAVVTLQVPGLTIAAGDQISIQAWAGAGNRVDVEVNASTYVRIIQP